MTIDVTKAAPADWDSYVDRHPSATAYHRSAAVCIGARTFGLLTSFLVARGEGGAIRGVLPLVEQSSLFFGRFLASVPFFTYGGTLADDDATATALVREAAAFAAGRRAGHLELRHSAPRPALDLRERLDKVSMVLDLPSTEEALGKQLGSKLRSQIRRADREQLEVVWGEKELVPDFYAVFASSMHQLGTPVYPRRFFDEVCRALEGLISVLVVRVQGETQAAAIVVRHGNRLEVPWAAATPAAKRAGVNMRMYWAMLQRAIQSGAVAFDFGRSTVGSGTYAFKAQWGAKPLQLHWHYWIESGGPLPRLNQLNRKYALAAALWKRMPLWCANLLGPSISRSLP